MIKPKDGNQGKGVTVNVTTKEQLTAGFHTASEFRDDILVERYLPGHDYRLLVVGDKMVAAARREPPQVIGTTGNVGSYASVKPPSVASRQPEGVGDDPARRRVN